MLKLFFAWLRHCGEKWILTAEQRYVERRYALLYNQAIRAGKPALELLNLSKHREDELNHIKEKNIHPEFLYLSKLASRLRVQPPDRFEPSSWYVSKYSGRSCLTLEALAEFKDAIQRAKMACWKFWPSG